MKKLKWCKHIKFVNGKWTQKGPINLIAEEREVIRWERFCSICKKSRPEQKFEKIIVAKANPR